MKNEIIRGAARLYYKENVEGEPLDQDTPIECFEAGAQFVLNAQKKRNNRNLPKNNSYNQKNDTMEKYEKILKNVEKIIEVKGFYITAHGDPSVGILPATWELRNNFYFDNQEELDEFRKEIKLMFEWYCGENTDVITFEEHEAMLEQEDQMTYEEFPVRYLIREGNNYKKAYTTAVYGSSAVEGIHFKLPDYIKEDGYNGHDTVIIKSTDPEFKEILLEEAERLETEIRNEVFRISNARKNLELIQRELKYGL